MFERYTEKARRVIFFARYEASQYGSAQIGTEHLLLGLLRESSTLGRRLSSEPSFVESVRNEVESRIPHRQRIPTSVEMPISKETKQALNFSLEEAEQLGHRYVGTEHMVLGLLRVEKSMAATILAAHGVSLEKMREVLAHVDVGNKSRPAYVNPVEVEDAETVLKRFLSGLRTGIKGTAGELLASKAQFIDVWGKRWTGEGELNLKFLELFAPFAARHATYLLEEITYPVAGLCVASLLWEEVPWPEKTQRSLCRMVVVLGLRETDNPGWAIYSVQVTPVVNRVL